MKTHKFSLLFILIIAFILQACNNGTNQQNNSSKNDSTTVIKTDSTTLNNNKPADTSLTKKSNVNIAESKKSIVLVYNFHVTNRCPSCIAIEKATTKTLETYFSAEVKQGRIKRQILNVDDKVNSAISEKYQAFGSGLFVTKILIGKETTTDLTGDGFKFARNKEERFIEILKSIITEDLK